MPPNRLRRQPEYTPPLDLINASVGDAAGATSQGYHSVARGIDGKVISAVHPTTGQRVNFINGLSPEEAATSRIRSGAAATPATTDAPIAGTAAPVSSGGMYTHFSPGAVRIAGTADDASDAVKQVASNPGVFGSFSNAPKPAVAPPVPGMSPAATAVTRGNATIADRQTFLQESQAAANQASGAPARPPDVQHGGYGKIGQVDAPPVVNTSLTGTTAVPFKDPKTAQTQVGTVTVGNVDPNGPADGGTGIYVNGRPAFHGAPGADGRPTLKTYDPSAPNFVARRDPVPTATAGGVYDFAKVGSATTPPLAPAGSTAYVPPAGPPEIAPDPGIAAGQSARAAVGNAVSKVGNAVTGGVASVGNGVTAGVNAVRGFLGDTSALNASTYAPDTGDAGLATPAAGVAANKATPTTAPATTPSIPVVNDPNNRNSYIGTTDYRAERAAPAGLATNNTPGMVAPPATPLTSQAATALNSPLYAPDKLAVPATPPVSVPVDDDEELKRRRALAAN